jgi:putative tricarboxylic transport membrane protein
MNRAEEAVVSRRTVELFVSILLSIVGIGLAISNWKLGARWAADGPQPGYFPFMLATMLTLASLYGIFDALRGRHGARNDAAFVARGEFVRVLQVLVPTILFCLATEFLGIYVAGLSLIAGFMRFIGKARWIACFGVAFILMASLFWCFEIEFQVPMPKGPIEDWAGY